MSGECSICLSRFKEPVSIPCGHVYCTKCLADHVNAPRNNDLISTCPTCRKPFNTVTPDLTYLHKKYHQYVVPSVRRIYFDDHGQADLKKRLAAAEARVRRLETKQETLMRECEKHMAASQAHAKGEQNANHKLHRLLESVKIIQAERNQGRHEAAQGAIHLKNVEVERDSIDSKYQKLKRRVHDLESQSQSNASIRSTSSSQRSKQQSSSRRPDTSLPIHSSRHVRELVNISHASASRPILPLPRGLKGKLKAREREDGPPPVFPAKRPRLSMPVLPSPHHDKEKYNSCEPVTAPPERMHRYLTRGS